MQLNNIQAWVDERKAEIEETLKQLVNMNTHTKNEAGVDAGMAYMERLAEAKGFTVETVNERHRLIKAGNGVAKPRILLIAHMDTVFPEETGFLAYQPLEDGFVTGPGVGDIKGGMLMGFWSMLALQEMHNDLDVQLVISANEEIGSPTIREWYLGGHIGADYAIGLEPGFPQGELTATVDLGVVYQRRGYCGINFTVNGKTSHSGEAHLGLNAIHAAAQRIVKIHELDNPERGISINTGIINGGTAGNTVAGAVDVTVSFRFERLADGEETRDAILQIIEASYLHNAHWDINDTATYDVNIFIPPMEKTDDNQKMVDIVLKHAQRLNHNVVPIARGGGSDANWVSGSGTPAICGMGAPAQGIHTNDEKIYLPMMFERITLLTSTVHDLIEQG